MDRDPDMRPLPEAFIERFLQTSAHYLSGQQTSTLSAAGLLAHDQFDRLDPAGTEETRLPYLAVYQTQPQKQIGRHS